MIRFSPWALRTYDKICQTLESLYCINELYLEGPEGV